MWGLIALVILGALLWFPYQMFHNPRKEALLREEKQTAALVKEIKKLSFKVDRTDFEKRLNSKIVNFIIIEKGIFIPGNIGEEYCKDMSGMVSKMYPPLKSLKYRHFTEAHQHIEFRNYLRTVKACYEAGQEGLEPVLDTLAEKLWYLMVLIPNEVFEGGYDDLAFETDVLSVIEEPSVLIENLYDFGVADDLYPNGALQWFRDQALSNVCSASGFTKEQYLSGNSRALLHASESRDPIEKQIKTYLNGLPFQKLFSYKLNVHISDDPRFEHHHIVAGSGHGKTQTLQYFIAHDLKKVVEEKASVVVIDSQGDLIRNIQQLDMLNETNMVVIDPTDVEFPVCLNLFSVQMDRINSYSRLHQEQMINGVLELYDFVLGSLLGAEMTQKQSVVFRYVTRLMLHVPDATIHTMLELFQDGGSARFKEHIEKLEGTARTFFEEEFDSREFTQTKRQVVRRLFGILENQTFNRMFSHPQSKVDLFSEMNAGKVILINTAKDLLKENGTEIFGRFFIAMIAQAAQERATIPAKDRMPTYVYIDEAQDYFDENIGIILSQARKFKVGMIMAHQYLDQLPGRLQSAFMSNTSIKFVGGVSRKDANSFAGEFRVDADEITKLPKGTFMSMIRGHTKKAIPLHIPFGHMEQLPKASKTDQEFNRSYMREFYAVPIETMLKDPESDGDELNEVDDVDSSIDQTRLDTDGKPKRDEAQEPEHDTEKAPNKKTKRNSEMPTKDLSKTIQSKFVRKEPPLSRKRGKKPPDDDDTSASDKL